MLGPIDYVVVGFQGNNFDGSIIGELKKSIDQGIIRVIDLMFIVKDKEGNVAGAEYEDQSDELKAAFGELDMSEGLPLFSEADIEKIGEAMDTNTAAGVLVIEHLWAKDLKQAILDANGFLIADGRIHPDVAAAAAEELETLKVS